MDGLASLGAVHQGGYVWKTGIVGADCCEPGGRRKKQFLADNQICMDGLRVSFSPEMTPAGQNHF